MLTVQAVAGPANAQPDGRRYAILAFARGEDEAEATQAAGEGMATLGWIDTQILRSGEITDPDAVPADLRDALLRARRDGCALIVYEQP